MADFSWLSDPNIIAGLGKAGASLSSGDPVGVALDPSEFIRNYQFQKASQGLINNALAPGQSSGKVNQDLLKSTLLGLQPTPVGSPGPNSVNHKLTPEGTTTTVVMPNDNQTPSPYQAQIPLEAVSNTPKQIPAQGGAGFDPFLQALLTAGM